MKTKRIAPSVLPQLKEALSIAFWYRSDLRAHLNACLPNNMLVGQLDWTEYKRNIVRRLVDTMAANQERYFEDLLSLLLSTAEITDPSYLKKVDGGVEKYHDAVTALNVLRKASDPYRRIRDDADEADRRRVEGLAKLEVSRAVKEKVVELSADFDEIVSEAAQKRGYSLEKFMNRLFTVFDIEAKSPFKIVGEQIDGAFSLEGTEYLLEAKWQAARTPTSDLAIFASKVQGKLDNTLGLFLSMNGFEDTAVSHGPAGRPVMILMDGGDLVAVLENRIDLPDLIRRKRRHAAQTGETYASAFQLLG